MSWLRSEKMPSSGSKLQLQGLHTYMVWQVVLDPYRMMSRAAEKVELKTLATIMRELGHTWVDILKIDVEGAEWDAFQGQLAMPGPLPFTQMQVCLG
jgi:FkbM family methyltransferase